MAFREEHAHWLPKKPNSWQKCDSRGVDKVMMNARTAARRRRLRGVKMMRRAQLLGPILL